MSGSTSGELRILLIRHGESEINVHDPPVIGGRSSWCELTPQGVEQARSLGRWLSLHAPPASRVISSTAVRAQQTARYCLAEVGLPLRRIELFPEIEELSQGEWENQPRQRILTPETIAKIEAENWHFRAPGGGESMSDVCARLKQWLYRELIAHPVREIHGNVWVFSHGVAIKALLADLFDLERASAWRIPIDNTSITTLSVREGQIRLLGQNETPHGP